MRQIPLRKTVHCDFFRLTIENNQDTLTNILENAFLAKPNITQRNVEIAGNPCRIDSFYTNTEGNIERTYGLFLRLRDSADARVARVDVEGISDLHLGVNEMLAEFFVFMYVPQYRILLIHRNKDAGRQGKFEQCIEDLCNVRPVRCDLVINSDAAYRIESMSFTSMLELKVSQPENLQNASRNATTGSMANISQDSGATDIAITLSAGHSSESIRPAFVSSVIDFVSAYRDRVKVAKVRGRLDGEMVLVDLIRDRMHESVDISTKNEQFSTNEYYAALDQAYSRRYNELRGMYDTPE